MLTSGQSIRHQHALESRGKFLELFEFPFNDAKKSRLAIIFQDITERKSAAATGQKLEVIVASSDDMIASLDLDGNFTTWNLGAEKMFGYKADEILFKPSTILLKLDQSSIKPDIFDRFENGGKTEYIEAERKRKDGSSVWISTTISPLRSADQKLEGASIIARDITERRRSEAHREILVAELNHRVKNTLAIVSAIASQTLVGAVSVKVASESFAAR